MSGPIEAMKFIKNEILQAYSLLSEPMGELFDEIKDEEEKKALQELVKDEPNEDRKRIKLAKAKLNDAGSHLKDLISKIEFMAEIHKVITEHVRQAEGEDSGEDTEVEQPEGHQPKMEVKEIKIPGLPGNIHIGVIDVMPPEPPKSDPDAA